LSIEYKEKSRPPVYTVKKGHERLVQRFLKISERDVNSQIQDILNNPRDKDEDFILSEYSPDSGKITEFKSAINALLDNSEISIANLETALQIRTTIKSNLNAQLNALKRNESSVAIDSKIREIRSEIEFLRIGLKVLRARAKNPDGQHSEILGQIWEKQREKMLEKFIYCDVGGMPGHYDHHGKAAQMNPGKCATDVAFADFAILKNPETTAAEKK